jgi:hypothetical protein
MNEIELWVYFLAGYGAVCAISLPLWWLWERFVEMFIDKDELIDEEQKWLIG